MTPAVDKNVSAFLNDGLQVLLINIPVFFVQVIVCGALINSFLPRFISGWHGSLVSAMAMVVFASSAAFFYSYVVNLIWITIQLKNQSSPVKPSAPYPENVSSESDPVRPLQIVQSILQSTWYFGIGTITFAFFYPEIYKLPFLTAFVLGFCVALMQTCFTKILREVSPAHRRIAQRFQQNRVRAKEESAKSR